MSTGDPRRHPIGFAPPAGQDAEQRFRTELSFRRHHELPRASATPSSPDDGVQPSWQSPDPDSVQPSWQSPGPVPSADVDQFDAIEEPPVAEESVSFFKREISFRRKKTEAVEAVAAEETPEEVELTDEIVAEAELTDDVTDSTDEWEMPALDVDVASDEPEEHDDELEKHVILVDESEPETLVAAEELTLEDGADEEAVAEPVAAAAVPFFKREISFRRNKPAAEVVEAALVADAATDDDMADPSEASVEGDDRIEIVAAVDEPEVAEVAAAEDHASEEPVAEKPHAVEDAPVFEIAAVHGLEPETGDEPFEDPSSADVDDAFAAVVPIGFASSADATDHASQVERPTYEPEVVEDMAAIEDVEDVEDADDAALLPAAVAAEAVSDAAPDLPDVAPEDAPARAGRFGSRKRKAEKSPRRNGGKSRKVVGLKIGASQLAAAVISETDRGHELLGLARRPLAAGIVVDGEVRDESALANALRSFFDDERLPKSDVRIGLSSNRIGVRTLDIDGVEDESRFDNAVRFKAHEVLPVALSDSVLDYRVLEERVAEDGARTRRVLLVVAPRDQVEPYTRVANLAGIRLDAVDLEALGLLRAFVDPGTGAPTADDTASVVVSIGHESSTLLVAGAGACEFTRVFDWGGSALEDAIASALDVRPAEAATILRHLSLSGPGRQYEALDEVTRAKATDAVRQRLTPFARELVNSLQFYQTQAASLGIGGIQITGGTSHLEGIDDVLHQMIGVSVSVGDPLSRVVRAEDVDPALEAMIGSLAVPIGLAIDDDSMRGVNLLPKGVVTKKSRRSALVAVGAPVAVAVPLAALAFLYVGAHGKVVDQQSELDGVKAELAALPQPTVPVIDSAVVGDEAVRATAVANVLGGRLAWESVFRDLSRVLPENVWLSTLSLTRPDPTNLADGTVAAPAAAATGVQAAPSAVSIDGFTFTQPDVARLLARLATLPSLKRVTLNSSTAQLLGKKKVVHFVIVADLNQNGGAS